MNNQDPLAGFYIGIEAEHFGALEHFLAENKTRYYGAFVISDDNVEPLYGKAVLDILHASDIEAQVLSIPAGEASKTPVSAEHCWRKMKDLGLDRRALVIGLGGGVATDLAGWVAACYMRGVDYLNIPTSLLAMVDAALGGKTGVNLGDGKNYVGAFHQPRAVCINLASLSTLARRELSSGMAEVIKYGVIHDSALFSFLEENIDALLHLETSAVKHIVERSTTIKLDIVRQDEKEQGRRAILNFGHTFAHALEGITNYAEMLHGEAVSIGMCCAAQLAVQEGMLKEASLQRIEALCQRAGLPTNVPTHIETGALIHLMAQDKKAVRGNLTCILPSRIGSVNVVTDVSKTAISQAINAKREEDT